MSHIRLSPEEIGFTKRNFGGFWNARQTIREQTIDELADNIAKNGILQDPTVREYRGAYQLVCGERRLRSILLLRQENRDCFDPETKSIVKATKLYETITVKVFRGLSDKEAARMSISENAKREDVPETDLMQYCVELESLVDEHGNKLYSRKEQAEILDRHASWISQTISLMSLPPEVLKMLADGQIPRSVALIFLKAAPECRAAIIQEATWYTKYVHEEELASAEQTISDATAELKTAPAGSRAAQVVNKKLAEALERHEDLKTSTPRMSQAHAEQALANHPEAVTGKKTVLSHKLIRSQRDRLSAAKAAGPVVYPGVDDSFEDRDIEVALTIMDMMLGESDSRTILDALANLYREQGRPGWVPSKPSRKKSELQAV